MVAVAVIGGGILSAGASIYGANTAASAQENDANTASNTQLNMFNQMRTGLQPYINQGDNANSMLNSQLSSLTSPVSMTEAQLEGTPGYQFNLTQGLKATQNSAAARGLGVSGAALKGASTYATGLADSTYQNQFNNAITNKQLAYNMLSGQQGLGENAAAGVGNAGINTGNSIASNTIGAGNASAAASISSGNAVGNAANSAVQGYTLNNLLGGNNSGYFSGSVAQQDAQQDAAQDADINLLQ
jgi:hypothetical protein